MPAGFNGESVLSAVTYPLRVDFGETDARAIAPIFKRKTLSPSKYPPHRYLYKITLYNINGDYLITFLTCILPVDNVYKICYHRFYDR